MNILKQLKINFQVLNLFFKGNAFNIVISSISFLITSFLILYFTEERMLNEGAKEFLSVVNTESFFLIWKERILLLFSQITTVIGLKIGLDLKSLIYLYSTQLIVIQLIIFIYLFIKKDYITSFYLSISSIIGISYSFFLYPFLEHLYAITFCFILLEIYKLRTDLFTRFLQFVLIALITSIYPTVIIIVILSILLSRLSSYAKFIHIGFAISIFLISIIFTEVSVNTRVASFDLGKISTFFPVFIQQHFDLFLLFLFTLSFAYRNNYVLFILPIILVSSIPYFFHFQIRPYHYMLPVGISIIYFAYNDALKNKTFIKFFFLGLFFINSFNVFVLGMQYRQYKVKIVNLINQLSDFDSSKFILVSETRLFEDECRKLDINIEETIKHVSLLFSSLENADNSIIIEDYFFNKNTFLSDFECSNQDSECKLSLITNLYNNTNEKDLYNLYFDKYEYSKYFFTNQSINKKYFNIDNNDSYSLVYEEEFKE